MELHPFFEHKFTAPRKNLWYVLATEGDAPSMRVGTSATFLPGKSEDDEGKLYFIGGANPDGTFSEVNILDLSTMQWDRLDTPSRIGRYEHAVATCRHDDDEQPSSIVVFGGAVQSGNLNDVQEFSSSDERWVTVHVSGSPPSTRTQHSMSAFFKNGRLVVFGGGLAGAEPVDDTSVYIFEPASATWTTLAVSGEAPKPRHGHLLLAWTSSEAQEERVYVHGGMAGSDMFDDLFRLDLGPSNTGRWCAVGPTGPVPCARAAHGGAAWKEHLYLFGGLSRDGALDDMWSFDIDTDEWTEIRYGGPPPPSRLDFASCLITLRTRADRPSSSEEAAARGQPNGTAMNGTVESTALPAYTSSDSIAGSGPEESRRGVRTQRAVFFIVHGGMDTEGTIFDDTLLFLVDSEPLPRDHSPE